MDFHDFYIMATILANKNKRITNFAKIQRFGSVQKAIEIKNDAQLQ